jgi:hypothetical protein
MKVDYRPIMATSVMLLLISTLQFVPEAQGQDEEPLPVLLIHGYNNDASV